MTNYFTSTFIGIIRCFFSFMDLDRPYFYLFFQRTGKCSNNILLNISICVSTEERKSYRSGTTWPFSLKSLVTILQPRPVWIPCVQPVSLNNAAQCVFRATGPTVTALGAGQELTQSSCLRPLEWQEVLPTSGSSIRDSRARAGDSRQTRKVSESIVSSHEVCGHKDITF